MYFVYVLQSTKDNGLYIGCSTNLKQRLSTHLEGKVRATKHRLPLKLIYFEGYANMADAKGREIFLKSGSGHTFLKKQLTHYFGTT